MGDNMTDKDCSNCKYYCDNGWRLICLNKKNKEGILAIEKGEDICEFFEKEEGINDR
jgi:recombinational DNA repair protein RecR